MSYKPFLFFSARYATGRMAGEEPHSPVILPSICRRHGLRCIAAADGAAGTACPSIVLTLNRFGCRAVVYAHRVGTPDSAAKWSALRRRIAALKRLRVDVDAWPAPPAELFVVEEGTVYPDSRSTITIAPRVRTRAALRARRRRVFFEHRPQLRRLFAEGPRSMLRHMPQRAPTNNRAMWNRRTLVRTILPVYTKLRTYGLFIIICLWYMAIKCLRRVVRSSDARSTR